jgi:hypothetical protein
LADPKIIQFIKNAQAKGYVRSDIEKVLISKGWKPGEIDLAFKKLASVSVQSGSSSMAIADTIKQYKAKGYSDSQIRKAMLDAGHDQTTIDNVLGATTKSVPLLQNKAVLIAIAAFAILLIIGIIFAISLSQKTGPIDSIFECTRNSECGYGEECINYECETKTITAPEPECTSNFDCMSNEECIGGDCIATGPQPECLSNNDCFPGQACILEECIEIECTFNENCNTGYECISNTCIAIDSGSGITSEENYELEIVELDSFTEKEATFSFRIDNTGKDSSIIDFTTTCSLYDESNTLIDSVSIEIPYIDASSTKIETCTVNITEIYKYVADNKKNTTYSLDVSIDTDNEINEYNETDNYLSITESLTTSDIEEDECDASKPCSTGYTCIATECVADTPPTTTITSLFTNLECNDGIDNDNNGRIDFSGGCNNDTNATTIEFSCIDLTKDCKAVCMAGGGSDTICTNTCTAYDNNSFKSCTAVCGGTVACDNICLLGLKSYCFASCGSIGGKYVGNDLECTSLVDNEEIIEVPTTVPTFTNYECNDGIDNNNNGKIDFSGGCDTDTNTTTIEHSCMDITSDCKGICMAGGGDENTCANACTTYNNDSFKSCTAACGGTAPCDSICLIGLKGYCYASCRNKGGTYIGNDLECTSLVDDEATTESTFTSIECNDGIDNDGVNGIDFSGGCDTDSDITTIEQSCMDLTSDCKAVCVDGGGDATICANLCANNNNDPLESCKKAGIDTMTCNLGIKTYCKDSCTAIPGNYTNNDPGCDDSTDNKEGTLTPTISYQCNDGIDNDNNGKMDYESGIYLRQTSKSSAGYGYTIQSDFVGYNHENSLALMETMKTPEIIQDMNTYNIGETYCGPDKSCTTLKEMCDAWSGLVTEYINENTPFEEWKINTSCEFIPKEKDSQCSSAEDSSEGIPQCNDGKDNDKDTYIDYYDRIRLYETTYSLTGDIPVKHTDNYIDYDSIVWFPNAKGQLSRFPELMDKCGLNCDTPEKLCNKLTETILDTDHSVYKEESFSQYVKFCEFIEKDPECSDKEDDTEKTTGTLYRPSAAPELEKPLWQKVLEFVYKTNVSQIARYFL